jgi:hypothetical protein
MSIARLRTLRRGAELGLVCAALGAASGCGSSEPGPTSQDSIASVCHAVAALPCALDSETDCESDLREERAQAQQIQCAEAFDAYVDCLVNGPFDCRDNGTPELPTSCEADFARYHNCLWNYDAVCSALPATPSEMTPCETTCGAASASCTLTTPLECVCTAGIRSGTEFSIDACRDLTDVIRDHCL